MHEVKINNTTLQIPGEWNELTRHHLELISGMASMGFTEPVFKSYLLFYIAGIHVKKHDAFKDPEHESVKLYQVKLPDASIAYLSPDQVNAMAGCFDFLFKRTEEDEKLISVALDSRLTRNLIPSFTVRGTVYYGPTDRLFNIIFSEFVHAETNLKRFQRTKEIQYLDKFIAVLYRPQDNKYDPESPDYKGDRRTPFNDHKIDGRAEKIHKLNHNVKHCIVLFYQGCQYWLQHQFPHVFSQPVKTKDDGLGYLGLVDALTGGDVTKTKDIWSSYMMDVMVHLERAAIEYERVKKELKKH